MDETLQKYLTQIQRGMVVPKDKYNEFGGFPYRNAESILAVFKAFIKKKEIPAVITFDSELFELLGRPYMRVWAELDFGDLDYDEPFKKPGVARIPDQKKGMSDEQILGSAFSYAAKYALCSLFAIDDGTVDPDTHNPADNDTTKQPAYTGQAGGMGTPGPTNHGPAGPPQDQGVGPMPEWKPEVRPQTDDDLAVYNDLERGVLNMQTLAELGAFWTNPVQQSMIKTLPPVLHAKLVGCKEGRKNFLAAQEGKQ